MRQRNNKPNKKSVYKEIMENEINQIKQLKTASYIDTKYQDITKRIICLYLQEMRQKNNKQNKK